MLAIEGDKSVCCDETVRKRIAEFPPEIKDHELLSNVKGLPYTPVNQTTLHPSPSLPPLSPDKAGADILDTQLAEAEKVLGDYVGQLEAEEKERKDLQELLELFVWQQRQQLRDTKRKLKVGPRSLNTHHNYLLSHII